MLLIFSFKKKGFLLTKKAHILSDQENLLFSKEILYMVNMNHFFLKHICISLW
jgi:hypothetical protein